MKKNKFSPKSTPVLGFALILSLLVISCNQQEELKPSTELKAVTINLSASAGNAQVSLSWSVSGTIDALEVYRDTDSNPSGRTRIASLGTGARSYTATGLSNGTQYWFWIKARQSSDAVWYNSNAASATPSGGGGGGAITGASCSSTGSTPVNATIRVTSGSYDGGCRTHNASSALGDGSQAESQSPIFRVENGATIRNIILGNNGADGIHTYNGATLDNITWTNVGEDAMTVKSSGTTNVRNIEGFDAADKFFQMNAAGTLNVSNAIIARAGKTFRQNGGTTFRVDVVFDRCDINTMNEGVFRTDSNTSTARLTNSRLHAAGTVCIGAWASCTQSGNTSY